MLTIEKIEEIASFIRDIYPNKHPIPLHEPRFTGNERDYVLDAIDSTFVSSVGAYVDKFERDFAAYVGVKRAVAVVNGTAGLQVALMLAGVKRDEEVITQALTFVATANAILYVVAHPVFLDVDHDTMGLSPEAVEYFLNNQCIKHGDNVFNKKTGRRIAAIMPMHTFGFPVNLEKFVEISAVWGIPLVEDAAEGLGSYYKEQHVGSFGLLGVFSFNGNKIITTGGGGMIVTNDDELANKAKHLTTTAKVAHPYEFYHNEPGFNFRLPNLNAALGCAQLECLDSFLDAKRSLSVLYKNFFKTLNINFKSENAECSVNNWLNAIELADKSDRDLLLRELNKRGIGCRPIWQLMFRLPMFQEYQRDHQANAIRLEERIVNIPSSVPSTGNL